jgi:hypothetical protein
MVLNDDLLEQFSTSMDAFRALREEEKEGWMSAPAPTDAGDRFQMVYEKQVLLHR